MRIQRMLKRYREELGEPIAIYQARPGWKAWLLLFAILAAGFSVLVMGSDAGAPIIIGAGVGVVLLFYFFFYTQIGEFLAVCERGFAAGKSPTRWAMPPSSSGMTRSFREPLLP